MGRRFHRHRPPERTEGALQEGLHRLGVGPEVPGDDPLCETPVWFPGDYEPKPEESALAFGARVLSGSHQGPVHRATPRRTR